jgi:type VI secretion system protein ImpJ
VTVNSFVARIVHLVASGNVHPFDFYGELASAAGALSSFKPQAEAWDLAPYIHDDVAPSYRNTIERIVEYLEQYVCPRNYVEVRCSWSGSESSRFEAPLTSEHFRDGGRYCLYFAGDRSPEAVRDEVKRVVRIGSSERMTDLIKLALRGIPVRYLDTPPQGLPLRPAAMFHIDAAGPEWERLKEDKRLAIHLPGLGDLAVSLFIYRA